MLCGVPTPIVHPINKVCAVSPPPNICFPPPQLHSINKVCAVSPPPWICFPHPKCTSSRKYVRCPLSQYMLPHSGQLGTQAQLEFLQVHKVVIFSDRTGRPTYHLDVRLAMKLVFDECLVLSMLCVVPNPIVPPMQCAVSSLPVYIFLCSLPTP